MAAGKGPGLTAEDKAKLLLRPNLACAVVCNNPRPCRYGDRCRFAHSIEEARRFREAHGGASWREQSHREDGEEWYCHPDKYKTLLCTYWERHGVCRLGSQCTFAHGEKELRPERHWRHPHRLYEGSSPYTASDDSAGDHSGRSSRAGHMPSGTASTTTSFGTGFDAEVLAAATAASVPLSEAYAAQQQHEQAQRAQQAQQGHGAYAAAARGGLAGGCPEEASASAPELQSEEAFPVLAAAGSGAAAARGRAHSERSVVSSSGSNGRTSPMGGSQGGAEPRALRCKVPAAARPRSCSPSAVWDAGMESAVSASSALSVHSACAGQVAPSGRSVPRRSWADESDPCTPTCEHAEQAQQEHGPEQGGFWPDGGDRTAAPLPSSGEQGHSSMSGVAERPCSPRAEHQRQPSAQPISPVPAVSVTFNPSSPPALAPLAAMALPAAACAGAAPAAAPLASCSSPADIVAACTGHAGRAAALPATPVGTAATLPATPVVRVARYQPALTGRAAAPSPPPAGAPQHGPPAAVGPQQGGEGAPLGAEAAVGNLVSACEAARAALLERLTRLGGVDLSLIPSFCCPLTKRPFTNPVVAADGVTYEKAVIDDWLFRQNKEISPTTGQPLPHRLVLQNEALRRAMQEVAEVIRATAA